jgi:DNA-binding MarR family transcriptional regulator
MFRPATRTIEGLQNLTESKMSKLIDRLLKQGNPTWEQYNELERAGELHAYFVAYIKRYDLEQGKTTTPERVEFIAEEFAEEERRSLYEANHGKIKAAILNHLADKNSMPMIREIAKATELSRQTIHNHLQNFDLSEYFPDEIRKYQVAFMGIMDSLLAKCMRGDLKAMRLYFDIIAFSSRRNPHAFFLLDGTQAEQPDSNPAKAGGPHVAYTKKIN